jgi:fibronectin-binding autotransporter adhesin
MKVRPRNRCLLFLATLAGLLLAGIVPRSSGQTDTFTAGSGNWSQTANWSRNALPMSNNDCAFLANGVITDDAAGVCQNVFLASGDKLTIATPSTPTSYLYVYGTSLTNPGTTTLTQSSGLHIAGNAGNVVTLSGGGSVVLTGTNTGIAWGGTGETRLVNADNTIQGQGTIGLGTIDLTNQKTIMSSGGLLDVQPAQGGLTNTGLMEAASGSTLQFDAGFQTIPFNNTGGTVEAVSGSTVNINSGTWNGGTFTTAGTGVMNLIVPAMNGVTNNGTMTVPSSGTPTFEGVTTNAGVIQLQGGIIYISGNAMLMGSGSLLMTGGSGSSLKSLNSTDTLTNQQLIHGEGAIYALSVTNQGTIQADNTSTPLSLTDQFAGGTPTTNKGTLQASGGGTLQIENTVNNTGGIIKAQNGSTVLLANGVVNGGTLTTAGTGTIQSQNGTLDGRVNTPNNTGTFIVPTPYSLSLEGTIANNGSITVDTNSCLDLLQPTTLSGSGQLTMNSGSCVTGSGQTFTNQITIEGAGNVGDSNPMPIVNNGTILANSTSPLTITPDVTGFTNNGTLSVSTGSTLTINGTFKNFASKTLSGGIYSLSGTLEFPNAAIATNAGNLTLNGTGVHILDSTTLNNALASLNLNNSKGTLSLLSGATLTTTTAFTNKGKTTVGAGSTLQVGSTYTQSGSTTTVDGTLTAPTGLTVKGGSLVGHGTISAAVTASGGSVTVGDSTTKPGVLTVTGSFTQSTTTANLNVAIGGNTVGTQYSQFAVSNGIALDGVLTIKLINHFVPTIGSTFTILKGTAVSGTFTTVKGISINSGEHFQVNYQSNDVTLSVVAGP